MHICVDNIKSMIKHLEESGATHEMIQEAANNVLKIIRSESGKYMARPQVAGWAPIEIPFDTDDVDGTGKSEYVNRHRKHIAELNQAFRILLPYCPELAERCHVVTIDGKVRHITDKQKKDLEAILGEI